MTKAEEAVVKAAIKWWKMRRPLGWKQAHHIHSPLVNCYSITVDCDLALAVGKLAKTKKRGK